VNVNADDALHSGGFEDLGARRTSCTHSGQTDLYFAGLLVYNTQRIEKSREDDHGGSVLVIMEDGDVELGSQTLFNLEAARC
jgi:hypothetical protein